MSQDAISFQAELCPAIPAVKNNKGFSEYCLLLEKIDYILRMGGVDFEVARADVPRRALHVRMALLDHKRKEAGKPGLFLSVQ